MVYFGVDEGSKAHRMYNPQSNRIELNRDVVFEESRSWEWKSNTECLIETYFSSARSDLFDTYSSEPVVEIGGDGSELPQLTDHSEPSIGENAG